MTLSAGIVRAGSNGGPPLDDPSLLGAPNCPIGIENLRYLGRLALPAFTLGLRDGEPMRAYLAGWIGEAAQEPEVAAGIARLAHFIELTEARMWRCPREILRVALCGIGLYPRADCPPEMPEDEQIDAWVSLLMTMAVLAPGHYIVQRERC